MTVSEKALFEKAFLLTVKGLALEGRLTVFEAYPAPKLTATIGAKYKPSMLESRTTTVAVCCFATSVTIEAYCFALKVPKDSLETVMIFSAP